MWERIILSRNLRVEDMLLRTPFIIVHPQFPSSSTRGKVSELNVALTGDEMDSSEYQGTH